MNRSRGFTLVELLVVLVVLGSLTTIAVRSLAGAQDRSRFEATQRVLRVVEEGILGSRSDGGTTPGLLADLGGLPAVTADGRDLHELWERPAGVTMSQVRVAEDGDVRIAAGWAGPYVDLPVGADGLFDGYGRRLQIVAGVGEWRVRSLGADGVVGGSGYDQDLELVLQDATRGIDRVRGELQGTVQLTGPFAVGNERLTVVLFEPDPATGLLVARTMDGGSVTTPVAPATIGYSFTALGGASGENRPTIGRRVLRVYVHPEAIEPWSAASDRGEATAVVVRSGAQVLDLRGP